MSLAVLTITCRKNPRFWEVGQSIMRTGLRPTWIVVDELYSSERLFEITRAAPELPFVYARPQASPARARGLPDHNRARNTALALADGLAARPRIVVFLEDQMVMSKGVLAVARVLRDDQCLRVPIFYSAQPLQPDSADAYAATSGVLRKAQAIATAGGCFAAPLQMLLSVGGFDEIYAGSYGKNDIDLFVRLERTGYQFLTSRGVAAVQWQDGIGRRAITDDIDALRDNGPAAKAAWRDLLSNKTRTRPLMPCDFSLLQKLILNGELFA